MSVIHGAELKEYLNVFRVSEIGRKPHEPEELVNFTYLWNMVCFETTFDALISIILYLHSIFDKTNTLYLSDKNKGHQQYEARTPLSSQNYMDIARKRNERANKLYSNYKLDSDSAHYMVTVILQQKL